MHVSDFNYDLPSQQIAQQPAADRAASRLLHFHRDSNNWADRTFREFPALLRPNDLLVLNNSRVFPARLFGRRAGSKAQPISPHNPAAREFLKGQIEVLLTKQVLPNEWECLVRPGRKIDVGERLYLGPNAELEATVLARGEFGERRIRFEPVSDFFDRIERIGHVPLPPYIARVDGPADRERYQTVYARQRGSVAAPTAGLHFTPDILSQIHHRGIEIAEITLHVGLGTFQHIHVDCVEDHRLHSESYEISVDAAARINQAVAHGRRVVAVGTTTVRTLEYAALEAGSFSNPAQTTDMDQSSDTDGPSPLIEPGRGEADLFIYPGFKFRVVGALLTNFHLPQSTLLMLVCAFGGHESVMAAYRHAVVAGYRFYSYGDCMFLE